MRRDRRECLMRHAMLRLRRLIDRSHQFGSDAATDAILTSAGGVM